MANKLDVETLNRLRGIGGSRAETAEKDKLAEKDNLAEKNEPQKTPSKPVDSEKTAALNNFLNSVPDNPVPDSERKYTTKDLDDFLDNFMKNHSSQS